VPIFLADLGDLASTRDVLLRTLDALRKDVVTPHLEVETYTWDVLPETLKSRSKADDIARELTFVIEALREDLQNDCLDNRSGRAAWGAA
jgi:hypothetical protein